MEEIGISTEKREVDTEKLRLMMIVQ